MKALTYKEFYQFCVLRKFCLPLSLINWPKFTHPLKALLLVHMLVTALWYHQALFFVKANSHSEVILPVMTLSRAVKEGDFRTSLYLVFVTNNCVFCIMNLFFLSHFLRHVFKLEENVEDNKQRIDFECFFALIIECYVQECSSRNLGLFNQK